MKYFTDTFKTGFLKLKEKQLPIKSLKHFSCYKATTNLNVLNNRYLEEAYHWHHHLVIETQFVINVLCSMCLCQSVLTKNYCNGNEKWTQGHIECWSRDVTYDVDVQSSIWAQHTNYNSHSLPMIQSFHLIFC